MSSSPYILKSNEIARRPSAHGERGNPIQLKTNLFTLNFEHGVDQKIYQYDVTVGLAQSTAPARRGRGRGRGRGGFRGRGPGFGNSFEQDRCSVTCAEAKTREVRRRILWYFVTNNRNVFGDIFNVVYNDFGVLWTSTRLPINSWQMTAQVPRQLIFTEQNDADGHLIEIMIVLSENCLSPISLRYKSLRDSTEAALPESNSAAFMAALFQQKYRFPIEIFGSRVFHDEELLVKQMKVFTDAFCAFSTGVYRIPRELTNYPGYEHNIAPGVKNLIGAIAALRYTENANPVLNFAPVNRLFYEFNVDIVTFVMRVLRAASEGATVAPSDDDVDLYEYLRNKTMLPPQIDHFNRLFSKLRVYCPTTLVYFGDGLWDCLERHFVFVRLLSPASGDPPTNRLPPRYRPKKKTITSTWDAITGYNHTALSMLVKYDVNGGRDRPNLQIITFEELYRKFRNQIRLPRLPLAEVKSGKHICIVPLEKLIMHDKPQAYLNIIDESMAMRQILCTRRPAVSTTHKLGASHMQITNLLMKKCGIASDDVNTPFDPFFQQFKLSVNSEFMSCTGRIIEPPYVLAHDNVYQPTKVEHRGFSLKQFHTVPDDHIPLIVVLCSRNSSPDMLVSEDTAHKFVHELSAVCNERDLSLSSVPIAVIEWDVFNNFEVLPIIAGHCQDLFQKQQYQETEERQARRVQHLVLIVHQRAGDYYGYIKTSFGQCNLINQVVASDTLTTAARGKRSIYYHLSMKINAKLGGVTHSLSESRETAKMHDAGVAFLRPEHSTMFIGIDVTHPSKRQVNDFDISIAGIVCSTNREATQYISQIEPQERTRETVLSLRHDHLEKALNKFCDSNGSPPRHVVVYRDGVSDSDLLTVTSHELQWIRQSLRTIQPDHEMTVTYIVAQKRHHVRFYPTDIENADGIYGNVPSGTSVDSGIVHPEYYDFYLAAHSDVSGTLRPIRYIVMYDEWKLGLDQVKEMTYSLCFLYARCARPVSLPPPLYYAHIICFQSKEHYKSLLDTDEGLAALISTKSPDLIRRLRKNLNTIFHEDCMSWV